MARPLERLRRGRHPVAGDARAQLALDLDRLTASQDLHQASLGQELRDKLVASTSRFALLSANQPTVAAEIETAAEDVAQLQRILRSGAKSGQSPTLPIHVSRLAESIDRIVDTATKQAREQESVSLLLQNQLLLGVAKKYESDSTRERSASLILTVFSVILLVSAGGITYWAIQRSLAVPLNRLWATFATTLTLCLTLCLGALISFKRASTHMKMSREYTRLQRGLEAMPHYLAPLPSNVQHLIRATMTATLFPRLLEDDDPMRQVDFPNSEVLMQAITGDAYEFVDEEDRPS